METTLVVKDYEGNALDEVDMLRIKADRKINFPRTVFGYDTKRVEQTISELKDLFNTQNDTFISEREVLKQENIQLKNIIEEQEKKLGDIANKLHELQSKYSDSEIELRKALIREDQHILFQKEQDQKIEQQNEQIRQISLEIREIEQLRKEKGELIAQKNILSGENDRLSESVSRLSEKNSNLNDVLEHLKAELREYKLVMIESISNLEASRKHAIDILTEKLTQSCQLVCEWQSENEAAVEKIKRNLQL